jgi:hypothetical protein
MLGRAMREAASDEQALSVVLHQQIRSLQALRRTIVGANVLQHDARHLFFLLRDQVRFLERSSNGLPVVRQ